MNLMSIKPARINIYRVEVPSSEKHIYIKSKKLQKIIQARFNHKLIKTLLWSGGCFASVRAPAPLKQFPGFKVCHLPNEL